MRHLRRHFCWAFVMLVGCDEPGQRGIPTTNTKPDTSGMDTVEVDGGIVACCTPEEPTCDCFQLGGTFEGRCYTLCDAPPADWHLEQDANGCAVWVCDGQCSGSCLPF